MNYDYKEKKIVAVLASNLDCGVALNVMGHLAIAIGAFADSSLMGKPHHVDGSGVSHRGISKYPVIVTNVKPGRLRRLIEDARQHPSILLIDYPEQMLHTGHDNELTEALASTPEEKINYLGAILYGDGLPVSELTGKFSLWR